MLEIHPGADRVVISAVDAGSAVLDGIIPPQEIFNCVRSVKNLDGINLILSKIMMRFGAQGWDEWLLLDHIISPRSTRLGGSRIRCARELEFEIASLNPP